MGKLVIHKDGKFLDSRILNKDVITIGRDSNSDIQLDDASVSRRHASLTRINNQYFVEDLGSTNGTYLNKKKVSMHILKNGDKIIIGHFLVNFEGEQEKDDVELAADLEKTVVFSPPPADLAAAETDRAAAAKSATLVFKGGRYAGQTKRIDGSLFTLGQPGGDVAVIARRPQGYFLLHIGGNSYPKINGSQITSTRGVKLEAGDVVEVGGIEAEITF